MTDRAGLTLLEVLGTLALATVLGGIAVLELRGLGEEWRLHGAVRQVVLDLRKARVAAIAQARSQGLRFETPSDWYVGERRTDAGTYVDDGARRELPAGILVTGCSARGGSIRFRPRGNAASFGTITLRGRGTNTRQVIVDMAGRVRVAQ